MFRSVKVATIIALSGLVSVTHGFAQKALTPELQIEAQTIIGGQITAFRTRDHDKAFGYAAPTIKKMFANTDRFIGMVKNGYGAIYGARNWNFGRGKSFGDTMVQEVLLVGPQGRNWIALYTLNKQSDGSWKIAGVQMKEGDGQST